MTSEFILNEAEESESDHEEEKESKRGSKQKRRTLIEEDEEEEKEKNEYQTNDGFVVEDKEEEEGGVTHGNGGDGKIEEEEPQEDLDEEDLELIEENIGLSVPRPQHKPYKRIKKRRTDDPDDLREKLKESLFGSDEDESPEPAPQEPEQEDVIYSDEEDDMLNFIEDTDETGAPVPRKRNRVGRRFNSAQMSEAQEVFGDFDFDFENMDERTEQVDRTKGVKLSDLYGPDELERQFFTAEDEEIRLTDLPEREQIRFPKRLPPQENELKEEAEWIFNMAFKSTEGLEAQFVLPKIAYVLEFLRVNHFEVPFIYAYRKGYYGPDLKLADLWEIYDWDEKWSHLQSRKATLKQLYNQRSVPVYDEYFKLLEESQAEIEVQDLFDHYQLHFAEDSVQHKRALKRDFYMLVKKTPVFQFTKLFGLSAQEFGRNLINAYMSNEPIDQKQSPHELAVNYTCKEFPEVADVMKAAKLALAQEFAFDPLVRQTVRGIYHERAQICTFPTAKAKKEVDAFHPYRAILRIEKKPASAFKSFQFLEILKAEKEGFITLSIAIPQENHDTTLHEMESLYLSDGYSTITTNWNEERKEIIQAALTHLYPILEKELRQKLIEEAQVRVASSCTENLTTKVMAGPYRTNNDNNDDNVDELLKVMTVSWGGGTHPTMCVLLDQEGEVISNLKLSYIGGYDSDPRKKSDQEKLKQFITEQEPHVIGVGAQLEAMRLFDQIVQMAQQLRQDGGHEIQVTWVDQEVASIYQTSARAERELGSEFSTTLKCAISLGRLLLDPLVEIANLCENNEVACLRLHPLQGMVNREYLNRMLERVFINVVNSVGVDINRAVQHKHTASVLQFVSGLGPRKAAALISHIFRKGGKIASRGELSDLLGETVYRNAVGFIRVVEKHFTRNEELEVLDDTRIHPDDYNLVRKMAQDAFDSRSGEDELVEELMRKPKKLEDIDLDAFAELLERNGQPRKRSILYDIKQEINKPYADPRVDYRPPESDARFTMLTGETDSMLKEGQLVTATVTSKSEKVIRCRLDSGLPAVVFSQDSSDSQPKSVANLAVEPGMALACRVKSIDKEKVLVRLTCKTSELQSTVYEENELEKLRIMEPYLISFDQDMPEKPSGKKPKAKIFTRLIDHPLFQNITSQEAEEQLKNKDKGQMIIRPSSRGYNYLTITWKCWDNMYAHINIVEEGKSSAHGLGKILKIGNETFEDLDEIVARYMEPIISFFLDMFKFRNFREGQQEKVDQQLRDIKASNAQTIPYFINLSFKFPGKFVLSYLPGSRPKHELVSVTPEGYVFRRIPHAHPEKLIKWFKQHWREAPPRSPQQQHQPSHANVNPLFGRSDFEEEPTVFDHSQLKGWGDTDDTMQLSSPVRDQPPIYTSAQSGWGGGMPSQQPYQQDRRPQYSDRGGRSGGGWRGSRGVDRGRGGRGGGYRGGRGGGGGFRDNYRSQDQMDNPYSQQTHQYQSSSPPQQQTSSDSWGSSTSTTTSNTTTTSSSTAPDDEAW